MIGSVLQAETVRIMETFEMQVVHMHTVVIQYLIKLMRGFCSGASSLEHAGGSLARLIAGLINTIMQLLQL